MDSNSFVHGGIKDETFLDFSISVNPIKIDWFDDVIRKEDIFRYTYVDWIEDKFQKIFGKSVIVAGATEAFHIIGYHILNDACVIIPRPNYSEYFKVAQFSAKEIKTPWYFVSKDLDLNVIEREIKLASKKFKKIVLILGNPNNPTGIYKDLEEFFKLNQNIDIVLDEAFIDFVENPKDYEKFDNVLLNRTFTKFFGIPGIRVGYVKTKKYQEIFKKYRMSWAIGGMGYTFLNTLLKNIDTVNIFKNRTISFIKEQKEKFKDFIYTKSDTNYFLVDVSDIDNFLNFCHSRKIHVRDARNFGLNLVRIGLKDKKSNEKLLNTLRKWRG
ncbi:aminotransferase class I/II-fold pyridoxal phosphate-dependent enzyme [Thermosipho globiformans]|uniref:aminotransferase class I/II-fold pyridoxal phosphate-dependent enzyme n=1 Tax=Thermosipho globiformans TaxID=380685 RepID=UPI000F8C3390|nr:aminotransferase class I/II-fold pyridoxal phosphate-dependent enzyme [Thermosipho globiformans]